MTKQQKFARWVFAAAGMYGLPALVPQYFLEERLNRDFPPPITHREHFCGFIGVAVAWQFAVLVIARDPERFRPLMVPAVVEKATFSVAAIVLYAHARVASPVLAFGLIGLVLGLLFTTAYFTTRETDRPPRLPSPDTAGLGPAFSQPVRPGAGEGMRLAGTKCVPRKAGS